MTRVWAASALLALAAAALAPATATAERLPDLRLGPAIDTGRRVDGLEVLPGRRDVPARILQVGTAGLQFLDRRGGSLGVGAGLDGDVASSVQSADLDRDGHLDLLSVGFGPALSVRWGGPGGSFAPPVRLLQEAPNAQFFLQYGSVAVADLDDDGRRDILVPRYLSATTSSTNTGTLSVLEGRGGRAFAALRVVHERPVGGLLTMNADGDRRRDIIAGGRVLRSVGGGRFVTEPGAHAADGATPMLGDVDGDGHQDLVLTFGDGVQVRRGGPRGLGPVSDSADEVPSFSSATVGDLDGDRRDDLVLGGDSVVNVLRGRTSGGFGPAAEYPARGRADVLLLADIDRDGRRDVVTAESGGRVSVLRNRGSGLRVRARLGGPPVFVAARRVAIVPVACPPGIDVCYGDLIIVGAGARRSTSYSLQPGERRPLAVPVRARPGERVRISLKRALSSTLHASGRLRAATAADRRASCEPGDPAATAMSDRAVMGTGVSSPAEACLFASGRRVTVDLSYPDGPFALFGDRWAAGMGRECGEGLQGCEHQVAVTDLRTGRTRIRAVNLPGQRCDAAVFGGGDCGSSGTVGLVVGPDAQTAWLTCFTFPVAEGRCDERERSVLTLDAGGVRVVATGPDIHERSLRVGTSATFSYVQAGVRRTVAWGGPPRARG